LRVPEFAMQMEVSIRDANGGDHADLFGDTATFPRLYFEFTNEEDEAIWRKVGGRAS
jgi:hypothetical protein